MTAARRILWLVIVVVAGLAGAIVVIAQAAAHTTALTAPTRPIDADLYRYGRIEPLVTPEPPAIVDPAPTAENPQIEDGGATVHELLLPHDGTGRVVMEATAGDVVIAISILILTAVNLVGMVIKND
jgi:hypothetical protein